MTLAETGRRLGLGKLALLLYHRPVGRTRDSLRHGGPFARRETERQRREMEVAAPRLGELPTIAGAATLTVHLMTGRSFWYQTAFCVHSLARTTAANLQLDLYDDGTVDAEIAGALRRLDPRVRIHFRGELDARRDALLPASRFPALVERCRNYPNIRKLVDVHLGSSGWKLVLDSDLLFFRRPDFLVQWLARPESPLVATDCTESYGYSRTLMEAIVGAPIPPRVNVGLCGLRSDALDWAELERWTDELQRRERTNYYLEQALVAMLMARQPHAVAPAADYITKPDRAEVRSPTAVMHHYVDTSKRWYFRHGWRHVIDAHLSRHG